MTYRHKSVIAQIHRNGRRVGVYPKTPDGTNQFGNLDHSYDTEDRKVTAFRTYPNRNTTVESSLGDRTRDNPVFLVAKGEDLPEPPAEEDYIEYDGQKYEVQAHTHYDTHVEFFGDPVIHDKS